LGYKEASIPFEISPTEFKRLLIPLEREKGEQSPAEERAEPTENVEARLSEAEADLDELLDLASANSASPHHHQPSEAETDNSDNNVILPSYSKYGKVDLIVTNGSGDGGRRPFFFFFPSLLLILLPIFNS
jgi:hypothetical protein